MENDPISWFKDSGSNLFGGLQSGPLVPERPFGSLSGWRTGYRNGKWRFVYSPERHELHRFRRIKFPHIRDNQWSGNSCGGWRFFKTHIIVMDERLR